MRPLNDVTLMTLAQPASVLSLLTRLPPAAGKRLWQSWLVIPAVYAAFKGFEPQQLEASHPGVESEAAF